MPPQRSGEEGIRTLDLLTASQAGLTEQNITNQLNIRILALHLNNCLS